MGVKRLLSNWSTTNGNEWVSVPLRGNGCETSQSYVQEVLNKVVSVPLRGNGCETPWNFMSLLDEDRQLVSVPLRGNGCETRPTKLIATRFLLMFPSPCGVMGVKLVSQEEIQDTLAYLRVSVPLRGNGCETHD